MGGRLRMGDALDLHLRDVEYAVLDTFFRVRGREGWLKIQRILIRLKLLVAIHMILFDPRFTVECQQGLLFRLDESTVVEFFVFVSSLGCLIFVRINC